MEFSNQMETLEKKAGETAAAVKAAAAASRLHSMTIDATGQSSFTTRWCGYWIRLKSRLSGEGIDFHRSTSKIMMSPHDRRPGQRRQSHRAHGPLPGWISSD